MTTLPVILSLACTSPSPGSPDDTGSDSFDDTPPDDTGSDSFDDTPPCDALTDPWVAATAEEVLNAYRYAPREGNATASLWSGFFNFSRANLVVGYQDCPSGVSESGEDRIWLEIDEEGCTTAEGETWSGYGTSEFLQFDWSMRAREFSYRDSDLNSNRIDGAYELDFDDRGYSAAYRARTSAAMSHSEGGEHEGAFIGHGEYGHGWTTEVYVSMRSSSLGVSGDYCVSETRTRGATDGTEWTDLVGGSVARIVWTGEGCGDVTIDGVAVGSGCL